MNVMHAYDAYATYICLFGYTIRIYGQSDSLMSESIAYRFVNYWLYV